MNCSEVAELAPQYLSGELDPARARAVANHLATCPACAREIGEMREVDARLRREIQSQDLGDVAALERRVRRAVAADRRPGRWIAAAGAAAAVVVMAGLGWFFLRTDLRLQTAAA